FLINTGGGDAAATAGPGLKCITMGRILDVVFDLILVAVVGRVLTSVFGGFLGPGHGHSARTAWHQDSADKKQTVRGVTVRDPVCGMFVSTELSHRLEWHGKTLHFCSEECLRQYRNSATA
ncbi:MAG: YHS domain-containing protein, partial [Terriglobia bacterium]